MCRSLFPGPNFSRENRDGACRGDKSLKTKSCIYLYISIGDSDGYICDAAFSAILVLRMLWTLVHNLCSWDQRVVVGKEGNRSAPLVYLTARARDTTKQSKATSSSPAPAYANQYLCDTMRNCGRGFPGAF